MKVLQVSNQIGNASSIQNKNKTNSMKVLNVSRGDSVSFSGHNMLLDISTKALTLIQQMGTRTSDVPLPEIDAILRKALADANVDNPIIANKVLKIRTNFMNDTIRITIPKYNNLVQVDLPHGSCDGIERVCYGIKVMVEKFQPL